MTAFIIALVLLVAGYFVYGLVVERIIGIDPSRLMPCRTKCGVCHRLQQSAIHPQYLTGHKP